MEKPITYKTAMLLEKAGFHRNVPKWYDGNGNLRYSQTAGNEYHREDGISAPNQEWLKNWLRHANGLHIQLGFGKEDGDTYWDYLIFDMEKEEDWWEPIAGGADKFPEHRDALEEGLQTMLNIILRNNADD